MAMYYEGYDKARTAVANMDEAALLSQLDALYGRDNLADDYTLEELRNEVYAQVKREFTDTSSKEYELVEFYTKLHRAMTVRN